MNEEIMINAVDIDRSCINVCLCREPHDHENVIPLNDLPERLLGYLREQDLEHKLRVAVYYLDEDSHFKPLNYAVRND